MNPQLNKARYLLTPHWAIGSYQRDTHDEMMRLTRALYKEARKP